MITNGYNIRYIDIDYLKRKGKSKIHPIRDTLNFVQIIIRTVLYFNPLKIFVPLSLILLFLGVAVFVAGLPSGLKLKTPFVVLFVSSIHMLSIGMIADLIDKRIPK
jgi:energy-coupling factor transporter transmembrane protein EcfT